MNIKELEKILEKKLIKINQKHFNWNSNITKIMMTHKFFNNYNRKILYYYLSNIFFYQKNISAFNPTNESINLNISYDTFNRKIQELESANIITKIIKRNKSFQKKYDTTILRFIQINLNTSSWNID